jgi:phage/plasmid-associated DNA primase
MLEGVKEYRRVGLAYPAVVKSKMAETRSAMDVLGEFISERCILGADQSCDTASLWNAWVQFARANGYEHAIKTKTALTQRLAKRGVRVDKPKEKINGSWRHITVYFGISLAEDALSQSDSDDDFIE